MNDAAAAHAQVEQQTSVDAAIEDAITNYQGIPPEQAATLARARVALAIAKISNGGDVFSRKAELALLEVQLAYAFLVRRGVGGGASASPQPR